MRFGVLDIVFALVIVLLAIRAAVRGLVRELTSIAAWIVGLGMGLMFRHQAGQLIASIIPIGKFAEFAGFVGAFLVGLLGVLILGLMLREGFEAANLGVVDNILGAVGGIAEGLAVTTLLITLLASQTFFDVSPMLNSSFVARTLHPIVSPILRDQVAPILQPRGSGNQPGSTTGSP